MTLNRLNDFDRERLAKDNKYVDLFILRSRAYDLQPAGDDIATVIQKGDSSYISEYPDQDIFDTFGFTLVITSVTGLVYTNREIFRHLTGEDVELFDTENQIDMYYRTFANFFPLI